MRARSEPVLERRLSMRELRASGCFSPHGTDASRWPALYASFLCIVDVLAQGLRDEMRSSFLSFVLGGGGDLTLYNHLR